MMEDQSRELYRLKERIRELEADAKNIHATLDAVSDQMTEFAYQELSSAINL